VSEGDREASIMEGPRPLRGCCAMEKNYSIFCLCTYVAWCLTLPCSKNRGHLGTRIVREICGAKWEEVTGKCRKLHNEALHNFTIHQIL